MDEIPDRTHIIFGLLRKRQCLAHEPRYALLQGAIEALNPISLPTLFAYGPMSFRRHNCLISFPEIAVANGALAIDRWQRIPESLSTHSRAVADMDADYLTRVAIAR